MFRQWNEFGYDIGNEYTHMFGRNLHCTYQCRSRCKSCSPVFHRCSTTNSTRCVLHDLLTIKRTQNIVIWQSVSIWLQMHTVWYIIVTNITLAGPAIVNWNRRCLIQGVTSVFVIICALGNCFGVSGSIKGSRNQGCHKQTRFGWEVEPLVYSDEGRCLHRIVPGSATSRHCTTSTYWGSSRHTGNHTILCSNTFKGLTIG